VIYFFFFLPNFTPGLSFNVELLPTSRITRTGYGFPLGPNLNLTVSPLFGPSLIFRVTDEPGFPLLDRFADHAVQGLDCIRRVNDFANLLGEIK